MPTLYIAEYSRMAQVPNSGPQAVDESSLVAEQVIGISGNSAASAAFNLATRFVRLHCDAVCSVKFSLAASPVAATNTNQRMAQNQTEVKGVPEGGTWQVAVISNS